MKQFLMFVLLLFGVAVSQAQPRALAADVKASAAAVFHYIIWHDGRTSSPLTIKVSDEKIFALARDEKKVDITAAASIAYLRQSGYNAYAGWRADKVAPYGDYSELCIGSPEVKAPGLIRWKVSLGYHPGDDADNEGSYTEFWVTMKQEKRGWRCVRREMGWSAG